MGRTWVVYREIHLVVFIIFIVFMVPVVHIIVNVFCKKYSRKISAILYSKNWKETDILLESNKNTQNVKNKKIKLKYSTKMALLFSLIFSFLYMVAAIVNVIYFYTKPNASITFHVIIAYVITTGNYIIGRSLLYLYFTLRARDTFLETFLEYRKVTIMFVITVAIIAPLILVVLITYIQLTFFDGVIDNVSNDNGTIVHIKPKNGKPNSWDLLNGALLLGVTTDLILAYMTLYLLVSKLFKLFYVSSNTNLTETQVYNVTNFHANTKQDNRMVCTLKFYIIIYYNIYRKE